MERKKNEIKKSSDETYEDKERGAAEVENQASDEKKKGKRKKK